MKKVWKWILGIFLALLAIGVIVFLVLFCINNFGGAGYRPYMHFERGVSPMMGGRGMVGFMPFMGLRMIGGLIPLLLLGLLVYGAYRLGRRGHMFPSHQHPFPPPPPPAAPGKSCPNCGKPLQDDWVSCPYCGEKM
jgi:hypothetical protein